MLSRLTAVAVAERLGIPVETLQQWTEELGIGARSTSGKRIFSPYEIRVLETVKALKDSERGHDTICRRIGIQSAGTEEVSKAKAAVVEALNVSAEWMDRYAKATHQIGQLEERVSQLQTRLDESRAQLAAEQALREERARPWWRRLLG